MIEQKNLIAQIYSSTTNHKKDTKELKIDNKKIRFFQEPLFKHCMFEIDNNGKWWLTFFNNSDYQQVLCVNFITNNQSEKIESNKLKYPNFVLLSKLAFCLSTENNFAEAAKSNSELIRGTKAITEKDHIKSKSSCIHVDGKGLSFITTMGTQERNFERSILLMALAQAYRQVIESLSNKLSDIKDLTDLETISNLYKEASTFNAKFFLLNPVKYTSTNLTEIWQQVVKASSIRQINEELNQQISSLHHIIDLENSYKMQKIGEIRNYIIGVIGIVLALFELFVK